MAKGMILFYCCIYLTQRAEQQDYVRSTIIYLTADCVLWICQEE
jgi:hypothetical protein